MRRGLSGWEVKACRARCRVHRAGPPCGGGEVLALRRDARPPRLGGGMGYLPVAPRGNEWGWKARGAAPRPRGGLRWVVSPEPSGSAPQGAGRTYGGVYLLAGGRRVGVGPGRRGGVRLAEQHRGGGWTAGVECCRGVARAGVSGCASASDSRGEQGDRGRGRGGCALSLVEPFGRPRAGGVCGAESGASAGRVLDRAWAGRVGGAVAIGGGVSKVSGDRGVHGLGSRVASPGAGELAGAGGRRRSLGCGGGYGSRVTEQGGGERRVDGVWCGVG